MAKRKVDTVLDQELKALLEESDQHVFDECAKLIEAAHVLAAEMGIILQE